VKESDILNWLHGTYTKRLANFDDRHFRRNAKTFKLRVIPDFNLRGHFNPYDNTITVRDPRDEHVLLHEGLHMASANWTDMKNCEDKELVVCHDGLSSTALQRDDAGELVVNTFGNRVNEGMTETMVAKIHPWRNKNGDIDGGYMFETKDTAILDTFLLRGKLQKWYFQNGLVKNIEKLDPKIVQIIRQMDLYEDLFSADKRKYENAKKVVVENSKLINDLMCEYLDKLPCAQQKAEYKKYRKIICAESKASISHALME